MRTRPRLRLGVVVLAAVVVGCDGGASGTLRLEMFAGVDQRGLPGQLLPEQVRLRLEGDGPVAGRPVAVEVLQGGGTVWVTGDRTNAGGTVSVTWLLGGVGPQRIRVTVEGVDPVEVGARAVGPEEADAVVVRGGAPRAVVLVSYDGPEPEVVFSRRLGPDESPTVLLPPIDRGDTEVVVFGRTEAPGIRAVTWTPEADRVEVDLRPPVPIDVRLVIHEPPFAERRDRALRDLERAEQLWTRDGVGIVVGDVVAEDRTAQGDSVVDPTRVCGDDERDDGRLAAHYVGDITIAADGYACGPREVYMARTGDPYPLLLAHEIGHALSLRHTDRGVMGPGSAGRMYDGQVFRAHVSTVSALNVLTGALPEADRRPCTEATCLAATFEVP